MIFHYPISVSICIVFENSTPAFTYDSFSWYVMSILMTEIPQHQRTP